MITGSVLFAEVAITGDVYHLLMEHFMYKQIADLQQNIINRQDPSPPAFKFAFSRIPQ
jgi:hypothetical protein